MNERKATVEASLSLKIKIPTHTLCGSLEWILKAEEEVELLSRGERQVRSSSLFYFLKHNNMPPSEIKYLLSLSHHPIRFQLFLFQFEHNIISRDFQFNLQSSLTATFIQFSTLQEEKKGDKIIHNSFFSITLSGFFPSPMMIAPIRYSDLRGDTEHRNKGTKSSKKLRVRLRSRRGDDGSRDGH